MIMVLLSNFAQGSFSISNQAETYTETRRLLLAVERKASNKALKQLFAEGHKRMKDLIRALDDSDKEVNFNSQIILKYFAAPEGLSALEAWYKKQPGLFSVPPIKLLLEEKYIEGQGQDLEKIVWIGLYKNHYPYGEAKDVSVKLIAYNEDSKTALLEAVIGEVFTEGQHVVLRKEGKRWQIISQNIVWQS